MNKRGFYILVAVLVALAGIYTAIQWLSTPSEQPASIHSPIELEYPEEKDRENPWAVPPVTEEVKTEYREKRGKLRIPLKQENLVNDQTTPSASMRLERERKEREIVPGVVFTPGEGVSIKLPDDQERIHIQRSKSDNGQYELLWKKKY